MDPYGEGGGVVKLSLPPCSRLKIEILIITFATYWEIRSLFLRWGGGGYLIDRMNNVFIFIFTPDGVWFIFASQDDQV